MCLWTALSYEKVWSFMVLSCFSVNNCSSAISWLFQLLVSAIISAFVSVYFSWVSFLSVYFSSENWKLYIFVLISKCNVRKYWKKRKRLKIFMFVCLFVWKFMVLFLYVFTTLSKGLTMARKASVFLIFLKTSFSY